MVRWEELAAERGYVTDGEGDPKKMLEDLYHVKKLSFDGLTKELCVSRNAIRGAFVKFEVSTRGRGGANNQKFEVTDELIDEIREKGVKATAIRLGVSYTTLYKRLYQTKPAPPVEQPTEPTS